MKDPAVLFYFQDFLVGTEFMTDDEIGKYIRILCHQADKGGLSELQLKRICRTDTLPEAIMEKLKVDEEGNYYQNRMRAEREKRISYSESRRKNRVKKDDNICESYDIHMENEDININKDEITLCWDKWKKYKKDEFGFKYKSDVSEQAAKSELLNLSNSNIEIAIKIIDQSIANGWKGFFKLKTDGRNKQPGASNEAVARIIAAEFGNDSNK